MCIKQLSVDFLNLLMAVFLREKIVRNFFEMINFSNYFNMVSDRGNTRCRNPAVVAQYMSTKAA